jgi:hypothetical protein
MKAVKGLSHTLFGNNDEKEYRSFSKKIGALVGLLT